ncbi:ADP-ribosylglycohydrolase family protein [Photobacterium chitinilyticum]|uniref:ADP-ribosylglycohydrolase family protein n=1 Tax=Photobacterium chitinilyticum TaxID=2485123 RepID=A0A444JQM6_9GAMM|nr:ADP-ribosylglycohydrolase family protein [Photobacterium chitinilyticum]RWX55401.1 ADP-ribosylglycohydrolase family protein [Photobacterium chitinilyticum]
MAQRYAALMGALVADAASMGTHWIYSPERIKQLMDMPHFPFIEPDAKHYEGVDGYYAHDKLTVGELTAYGEWLALYIRLLGHADTETHSIQQHILEYFGPGGEFIGYIDSPTKALLLTLFSLSPEDWPEDSGCDDDQNPALCAIPALVSLKMSSERLEQEIERIVGITHQNETAVACSKAFACALNEALRSRRMDPVLNVLKVKSPEAIREKIEQVRLLSGGVNDLGHVLALVNQACHLADSLPMAAWILQNSESYTEAVINNILVSGDTCGRGILVGALAGACYGFGNEKGIPISWVTTLQCGEALAEDIEALLKVSSR